MRTTILGALFALGALALAAGCGSSAGNTSTPTNAPVGTPTPTYAPTGAPSTSVPVSTSSPASANIANGNFGVAINFPQATSGGGTMTVTGSTSVPTSPAVPQFMANGTEIIYVVLQPSATVTFPSYPQFELTLPSGDAPQGNNYFGAIYTNDATFPQGFNAWYAQFLGAARANGQVLTYPNPSTPLTFTGGDYYVFCLYAMSA